MVSEARFKKTEIGMLPYDWKVTNIKSVADKKQEHSFIDGDWIEAKYIENQGIRLIQTGNIGIGHFIDKESKKYISEKTFKELNCKEVKPGDILICRLASPIGRACIAPDLGTKAITAVDVVILKVDEKEYSREYINYYLNFGETLQRMESLSSGSTRQRISRTNLGNVLIAIPPLPEQRKIAAILSSVDEAIEKTEDIIEQTEKVKKGLMQQLLTKGIGHTKFKKTEIGEIPEEWEVRRLEEICEIRYGKSPKGVKVEYSDYPIMGTSGHVGYAKEFLFSGPMILVGRKGTIDKPIYIERDCWIIDTAYGLFADQTKVSLKWLYYFLTSYDLASLNEATGVPSLNRNSLYSIKVPLPSLNEQNKISNILTSIEQKIETEKEKLSIINEIKKGLMQSLLTGKVRVKVDEDEVVSS